jgi:hypothetical protein
MAVFHKIVKLVKNGVLMIIHAPIDKTTVQIAYKLSINEWQGKTNLQLMV